MENNSNKWGPVDYIVSLIVLIIFIVMVITVISPYLSHLHTMSEKKFEVVSHTTLALITIISLYVGSKIKR